MQNSETRIIIAGFGGQGVVLAGTLIAQACMSENKNVTMMVSYGAEMRGGTANSTLVVSDVEITGPHFDHPDVGVIMNRPSMDRFEPSIAAGGWIIVNTSLCDRPPARTDVRIARIDATGIAHRLGNVRVANLVALGAFLRATSLLPQQSLIDAVRDTFARKGPDLVAINTKALCAGAEAVQL